MITSQDPELNPTGTLTGKCYICDKEVDFSVDSPADGKPVNWRETLSCPGCGLINRWRSCLHLFDVVCKPAENDRIYLTERLSPVYENLAARYPSLFSSEYFPGAKPGEMVQTHGTEIRHEDVTRLSFADTSMDSVLCFDVLEHVPDYKLALKEFYRVLNCGGGAIISVPFSFQQQTVVRAIKNSDGGIEHLMEPCFHGDPLSAEGVLSYYDFGMELLDDMRSVGFKECFLVCFNSRTWGYLNNNIVFVARKL